VAYLEIGQEGEHTCIYKGSEEGKSSSCVRRQSSCGDSGAKPHKLCDVWNFELNLVHVFQ